MKYGMPRKHPTCYSLSLRQPTPLALFCFIVLDGLLYNESDLEIEEHYTDIRVLNLRRKDMNERDCPTSATLRRSQKKRHTVCLEISTLFCLFAAGFLPPGKA
jgi:hypothetical protein